MQSYIKLINKVEFEKLKTPAKIIAQGGIVIFPTETVYGIGTNGLNEEAVKRLYKVKQRPLEKPISLLVTDIEMVEKIAQNITKIEYKIMEKFFPGPLTIILEKRPCVPNIVSANGNTIGVRMPAGDIARRLVEYAEVPIAAPSANISGKPSGTNIEAIKQDFEGKVDFIIDAGESKLGIASTIVKVMDGVPHIIREGAITKEMIEQVI